MRKCWKSLSKCTKNKRSIESHRQKFFVDYIILFEIESRNKSDFRQWFMNRWMVHDMLMNFLIHTLLICLNISFFFLSIFFYSAFLSLNMNKWFQFFLNVDDNVSVCHLFFFFFLINFFIHVSPLKWWQRTTQW